MKRRLAALAVVLSASLASAPGTSWAGPSELAELLHSPAARQVLGEILGSGSERWAAMLSAEDASRAEAALDRWRSEYLRMSPGDEDVFRAGDVPLEPAQVQALRQSFMKAAEKELRSISFFDEATVGSLAATREQFLSKAASAVTPEMVAQARSVARDTILAAAYETPAARARAMRKVLASSASQLSGKLDAATLAKIAQAAGLQDGSRALAELAQGAQGSMTDDRLEEIAQAIRGWVGSVKISESAGFKALVDPSRGYDLASFPKEKAEAFNTLLSRYYDQMATTDKMQLFAAMLGLAPDAPAERQLSVVLQKSGPAMQKLFQLFGRDAKSNLIRKVMEELLASVEPFDGALAERIVQDRLGDSMQLIASFERKELASATVGQVHRATLTNGRQVIIKVLRPGIREKAMREIATLKAINGGSFFETNLIENVEEALMREMDLRIEADNLVEGLAYSSRAQGITVAGLVEGFPVSSDVIVQHMAEGKSLSRLPSPKDLVSAARLASMGSRERMATAHTIAQRGAALQRLLERWFERAIFGDGFFHADLHPGNLFLANTRGLLADEVTLTLIDFGSCDRLTALQRRGLIRFALAVSQGAPRMALQALGEMTELTPEAAQKLAPELNSILTSDQPVFEKVKNVLNKSIDSGVRVPTELFMFTRGDLFIEKQLREVNEALDVLDPGKSGTRFDPLSAYLAAASKHIVLDTPARLMGRIPSPFNGFGLLSPEPEAGKEVLTRDILEGIWGSNLEKMLLKFGAR